MTVLLLGGNGFIGSAVTRSLVGKGTAVVSVSRTDRNSTQPGVVFARADRSDLEAIRALIAANRVDIVIDIVAFTEASTRPLLQALAGCIGRYVLVSSCDVYRNYGGFHRRESAPPLIGPANEDSPLRTALHPYRSEPRRAAGAADAWMDDYDKIPIEQALAIQSAFDWSIARLPMVFGPGDRQRRFSWAIRPMAAGKPAVEIDAQWAQWRSPYGYVADVAAAIALIAGHADARNRVFNIAEAETPDNLAWGRRFAAAIGWQGEFRLLEERRKPSPLDALDLSYPLCVDTSRIRSELGYLEPTGRTEALQATIADEMRRG